MNIKKTYVIHNSVFRLETVNMIFVDTSAMVVYTKEFFVDTLHDFPHVNFSFQITNSTFDPNSISYREVNTF